jgi:hypothetical protein
VYDNIPFVKVESKHFRKLFARLHPFTNKSVIPAAITVSRWVKQELLVHRDKIRQVLKTAITQIHLSFNLWTNRRRKAINSITAHFVNKKGSCRTLLLALSEMDDCYSGKNIAANTLAVIKTYGFQNNVGCFVLDNAYSNDVAIDELSLELSFDAHWRRLRCAGYILNLIACSVLFGNDYEMFEQELASVDELKKEVALWRNRGPVGMITAIVQWINKSLGRVLRFERVQREQWYIDNLGSTESPVIYSLIQNNSTW